jgi:hypothetical protein
MKIKAQLEECSTVDCIELVKVKQDEDRNKHVY